MYERACSQSLRHIRNEPHEEESLRSKNKTLKNINERNIDGGISFSAVDFRATAYVRQSHFSFDIRTYKIHDALCYGQTRLSTYRSGKLMDRFINISGTSRLEKIPQEQYFISFLRAFEDKKCRLHFFTVHFPADIYFLKYYIRSTFKNIKTKTTLSYFLGTYQ